MVPSLEKAPKRHITWKKRDASLTAPYSPPSFLSMNISAVVSSPHLQHPRPWILELLSLMVHSLFSQVEERKEVPPLLAPPLVLSSVDSPPTCDRDPLSQISVFHFHLLEIIPSLAGMEAVILEMSQNNFSAFSQASRHQGLNLHQVGL